MSINIWTDSMQHAALLGKPVLFTNWLIQRDIIPDGWYCYDLRGTHKSPSTRTTLVDHAADYHAGTVLSPIPLKHEGNQFAQYRLGKLLLQGEDAPKDVKAAIRWLTAAAEQGNQYAQYALGKLYLLGKEVPKDRSSAIKWFQLAADQGNEYAQYFLKHMDDRLGQPPVAAVISLFHHLANIFQEQNQPPPSGGVRVAVDRKLLRKIKAKKIAQGHKADDHEPEMQL